MGIQANYYCALGLEDATTQVRSRAAANPHHMTPEDIEDLKVSLSIQSIPQLQQLVADLRAKITHLSQELVDQFEAKDALAFENDTKTQLVSRMLRIARKFGTSGAFIELPQAARDRSYLGATLSLFPMLNGSRARASHLVIPYDPASLWRPGLQSCFALLKVLDSLEYNRSDIFLLLCDYMNACLWSLPRMISGSVTAIRGEISWILTTASRSFFLLLLILFSLNHASCRSAEPLVGLPVVWSSFHRTSFFRSFFRSFFVFFVDPALVKLWVPRASKVECKSCNTLSVYVSPLSEVDKFVVPFCSLFSVFERSSDFPSFCLAKLSFVACGLFCAEHRGWLV
jgi:FtsZ-binding cell division protein ZapB